MLLMKNMLKMLAKIEMVPLGLTATASGAEVGILKKNRIGSE